jgi:hypothetical protein
MAKIWYGHFDSTPDDERVLLAEDWARYIRAFITNGIRNGGTCLQVSSAGGMSVKIAVGTANIQGYILDISEDFNGSTVTLPVHDANPSYPRIDRVILRLDRTIQNRAIIPMVLTGTAAAKPVPPILTRNENIYELSLAQVYLNAGVLQIYDSNITDERFDQGVCGLMHSVLGLDSKSWQTAFDTFMASIQDTFNNSQNRRTAEFQRQTENIQAAWADLKAIFQTWFDGAQSALARAASFSFWNAAALPGNRYVTEYPKDGSIVTTITNADGAKIAIGTTTYPANGSVVYEEKVFQTDGVTIQRHTRETTTYRTDGAIQKEVKSLL